MPEFKNILFVIFGGMCIASRISATVLFCAENRTDVCKQNLATFITLDKPRFASEIELERLCREAEDGQRCSSDFLKSSSCIPSDDHLLISLQIGRSQSVSQMLCSRGGYITDPAFRQLYLKHAPCIDEHKKRIKECHVSSGVMEEPEFEIKNSNMTDKEKHTTVCCPLVQYIECSENAIGRSCGNESKDIVLEVLLKTGGKELEDFCKMVDTEFPNNPTSCMNSSVKQVISLSVYFVVYLSMFVLYITV